MLLLYSVWLFLLNFYLPHFLLKLSQKEIGNSVFTLGALMNTRGLVGLIALNIGLSSGVLSVRVFTVFVLMALLTTLMTSPILWMLYGSKLKNKSFRNEDSQEEPENQDQQMAEFELIKENITDKVLNEAPPEVDLKQTMTLSPNHQNP